MKIIAFEQATVLLIDTETIHNQACGRSVSNTESVVSSEVQFGAQKAINYMVKKPIIIDIESDNRLKLLSVLEKRPHLLRHSKAYQDLPEVDRHRAQINLCTAIQLAAFPDSALILNRPAEDHCWDLHIHNQYIQKLVVGTRNVRILGDESVDIDFGNVLGCTTVYPLTSTGFNELVSTDIGVASLFPRHIVKGRYCARDQLHFYIGLVADLRGLDKSGSISAGLHSILHSLLKHIGFLCPPLRWGKPAWFFDRELGSTDGTRLPRFCAFAYPNSLSSILLDEAGFEPVGKKWNGEIKYSLDLYDWNSTMLDERRRKVRRVIRAIQWASSKG